MPREGSEQPEWGPLLPLITAGGLAQGLASKQVGSDSSGVAVTSRCLRSPRGDNLEKNPGIVSYVQLMERGGK